MKNKLKIVIIGFSLFSALFVSGCNTVKGFGQDLEQGGQHLQQAANNT